MPEVSQTFSELWYRVEDFCPRLSSHLSVRRHTYRDETWFVIGDPASAKFYRFNASAYRFLGLLDGHRTVQEAWDIGNAQLGDDAPTQKECLELLAQLQMFGLLRNDLPVDVQRLRERFEHIREQKFQQRAGHYVFWTIPLINPERFLARFANVGRVLFGSWGFIALAILVLVAIRMLVPRWEELAGQFNNIIAPQNIILLSVCFLGLKVLHEFAHGLCCKAYGGRVTEIGVMFMIVLPIPYCDATSSWAFPNKWHRILVSSAGMMVEAAVACFAAIIWARTDPGLAHSLSYNVMVLASVITILFNLNPLLRYDGYYILADWLEIPNLATRSHELLKWLTRRYLFGLKGEPVPAQHDRGEGAAMVTHAVFAFPYRLIVMAGIVSLVAQKYFIVGLALALVGGVIWFLFPIAKGLSYVISDPSLQLVRARAILTSFGVAVLAIVFVGFVPMPARVYSPAIVTPNLLQTVRAPEDGFLNVIFAEHGSIVHASDPLFVIDNPFLTQEYQRALAGLEIERLRIDTALVSSAADRRIVEPLYADAIERLRLIEKVISSLQVTAPHEGIFIAPDLLVREGAYVKKGSPIGMVSSSDDVVLRVYVSDNDFAWLDFDHREPLIEARTFDQPDRTTRFRIDRVAKAGVHAIRHPSLGHQTDGGSVVMDPTDRQGQRTIEAQWEITLRPYNDEGIDAIWSGAFQGTRARVRFSIEPEPLAKQWYRRIRQVFAARYEL